VLFKHVARFTQIQRSDPFDSAESGAGKRLEDVQIYLVCSLDMFGYLVHGCVLTEPGSATSGAWLVAKPDIAALQYP
jgi:hypothetical protein